MARLHGSTLLRCAHSGAAARHRLAIALSAGYLVASWLGARYAHFTPPIRGFAALWFVTIGIDLGTFTALQVLQGGNINYTPLFALPVLMSAVLGTVIVSLGTCLLYTSPSPRD